MYSVKLDETIGQIISSFFRLGLWHRGDEATVRETRIKWFYSMYTLLWPASLIAGAILSDNQNERIFLVETTIMTAVMSVKLFYIIWRKNGILELLDWIGNYIIPSEEEYARISSKLKSFMSFMKIFFLCSILIAVVALLLVPFVGSERKLFFNIGFPLDWKNDEFAYWIAFTFLLTEVILSAISVLFSILMWYLLFNCGLRYEILGSKLRNSGTTIDVLDATGKRRRISELEKRNAFRENLIAGIESHSDVIDSTKQLESFLSHMLSVQIITSGLCICGSTYCLAYAYTVDFRSTHRLLNNSENLMEFIVYLVILIYNICDVFMVLFFGNEIKLLSDQLSYCLFESDWIDQPQSSKKLLIIFGERLKQSPEIIILKLYPMTLYLFTRILNSAYSMFNILKTLAAN